MHLKVKQPSRIRVLIWTNTLLVTLITLSLVWSMVMNWQGKFINSIERDRHYSNLSGAIVEYYSHQKQSTSYVDVKTTLKLLDKIVPEYFKGHEFRPDDFIALAIIESGFDKNCVGKRGERGMFQILDWKTALIDIGEPLANPFDIEINIRMSCNVLKQKNIERKNYRDSIIAYNGYIVTKDGLVIDRYWKSFVQAHKLIKELKERSNEL